MTLAFIWYFKKASQIMLYWRDGLRSALEILAKDHQIVWYLDEKIPDFRDNFDVLLFWGDSNCPVFLKLDEYHIPKKGLFLSTMPVNFDNLKKLTVVYCESQPVYDQVRQQGIRAILAFGTDTEFFKSDKTIKKDIPYFYPATFSPWKRQSSLTKYGANLLCVGTIQPDGKEEVETCQRFGVNIEIGYFPAEKIRSYYNRAENVVIPAIHGSERTVLEAMSMNILPIVEPMNLTAISYVKEYNNSPYKTPREFIVDRYSHIIYSQNILKGL